MGGLTPVPVAADRQTVCLLSFPLPKTGVNKVAQIGQQSPYQEH